MTHLYNKNGEFRFTKKQIMIITEHGKGGKVISFRPNRREIINTNDIVGLKDALGSTIDSNDLFKRIQ